MRNALSAFLVLLICTYASSPASAASAPAHLRFAGADWRVLQTSEQGRVTVADHDGREAIVSEWLATHEDVGEMEADIRRLVERWLPAYEANSRSYFTNSSSYVTT